MHTLAFRDINGVDIVVDCTEISYMEVNNQHNLGYGHHVPHYAVPRVLIKLKDEDTEHAVHPDFVDIVATQVTNYFEWRNHNSIYKKQLFVL
jgi:hypothetical protein